MITDGRTGESAAAELGGDVPVRQGHWSNYFFTVCRRFGAGSGADIRFTSNLPSAAGLSSSSALIVGAYLVLAHVNGRHADSAETLAEYLGAVESGVGTHGGSEDHTAMLCARAGALVQFSFSPIRHERTIPLPAGCVFVVAVTGVLAAKSSNAMMPYNDLAALARDALYVWRRATGSTVPTLAAALQAPEAIGEFREVLRHKPALLRRVEQLEAEREIIAAAGDALLRADLETVGTLVDQSQANAERWLGNQTAETIFLPRQARELGAIAASAFGAGFGGSVYALVNDADATDFERRWREVYLRAFPARASAAAFFVTHAGPPARLF